MLIDHIRSSNILWRILPLSFLQQYIHACENDQIQRKDSQKWPHLNSNEATNNKAKEVWERLQNTRPSHLHVLVCFEEQGI